MLKVECRTMTLESSRQKDQRSRWMASLFRFTDDPWRYGELIFRSKDRCSVSLDERFTSQDERFTSQDERSLSKDPPCVFRYRRSRCLELIFKSVGDLSRPSERASRFAPALAFPDDDVLVRHLPGRKSPCRLDLRPKQPPAKCLGTRRRGNGD